MISICFFCFLLFIVNFYKNLDALSLLLNLELLILIFLNMVVLLNQKSTLGLFGLSFFFMSMAVLAATMGLVTLSGLKKINEFTMSSLNY